MSGIIIIVVVCVIVTVQGNFPDDPKPCKYGDSKCIVSFINHLIAEKSYEGDSSLNLDKLDPYPVDKLLIRQGENSPLNIKLDFTNNHIHGLTTVRVKNVRGFGKNLTKRHELVFQLGIVSFVGDYTIDGKVLILPIAGQGKSNMTLVNPEMTISFTGKAVERNGENYMELTNISLDAKPERVIYQFGNLFNGDKALGDNMNTFLNDNWSTIFQEVGPSLKAGFGRVYGGIISKVFTKYPYAKFFEE